jgi:uncharacterized protein YwqG
MTANRDEAESILKRHCRSGSERPDLQSILEPSLRIQLEPAELDDLPIGASRFGGPPDMPEDFQWPVWTAIDYEFRKPAQRVETGSHRSELDFIAQINLADLAPFDIVRALPDAGWLYFFYDATEQPWGFDPRDKGGARVFYHTGTFADLRRVEHPAHEHGGPFNPRRATFEVEWTAPSTLAEDPQSDLDEEIEEAREAFETELYGTDPMDAGIHRLFGHPQAVQGDMQTECQLVSNGIYCGGEDDFADPRARDLARDAGDWRLLLQVDTDEDAGWMWGDVGRLYFWIRKQDLAERRFDRTWTILQCY